MNPKIVEGIFALIIAALLFGAGFMTDRVYYSNYKGEVKGAADVRGEITKAANTKNEGDYHASNEDITGALQNQADYYKLHPIVKYVRVQDNGCSAVPGPADNTQGGHGATTGSDVATYLSPYSPEEVEQVAARLDNLQQRLLKAGVTVR